MHFPLTTAFALLLTTAHARINGIAVPATIKPGEEFDAIILSSNYIQSVYDVAIAFGYTPGDGYPGSLGQVIDSFYLGPGKFRDVGMEGRNEERALADEVQRSRIS